MRKICLTVVGLYLGLLHAYSQFYPVEKTSYQQRSLKLDEVNLVSSYYWQNGNHSAVTGGIGTEQGTDLANGLELKWLGYDLDTNKHSLTASMGIDHHTSASQAYVSKDGSSKSDGLRIYPELSYTAENRKNGSELSIGAYYSSEYSYHSLGLNTGYSQKNASNGGYSIKLNAFYDRVKLIYPSELRSSTTVVVTSASGAGGSASIPSNPRFTLDGSFGFAQVINPRLQASLATDLVFQSGDLGLPFHRVYFTDGTEAVETLPSIRLKFPIGLRLNYFAGDNVIIRGYYRFYLDTWGILSHTANLELPVKLTPFFSISPFYRYYIQTAANYFAAYGLHSRNDTYFTSNYALSSFSSQFFGIGFRAAFIKSIGSLGLNGIEARFGHYAQTTDLVSNVISVNLKFK